MPIGNATFGTLSLPEITLLERAGWVSVELIREQSWIRNCGKTYLLHMKWFKVQKSHYFVFAQYF